jgi:hypothetical protein
MWKKFYSNSGLILLAVLGVGVWTSNALSFFASKNTPQVDAVAAPSPAPSFEELLEKERLKLTPEDVLQKMRATAPAICRDGTYSFSSPKTYRYRDHRRDTCSQNGGVAQWLSR